MNMTTKKIYTALFSLAVLAAAPDISFGDAPTLDCPSILPPGTYTGKLVNLIDKDFWSATNYILKQDNGNEGCVQISDEHNPVRANIVREAFLNFNTVKISVDNNHAISGIGYGL